MMNHFRTSPEKTSQDGPETIAELKTWRFNNVVNIKYEREKIPDIKYLIASNVFSGLFKSRRYLSDSFCPSQTFIMADRHS